MRSVLLLTSGLVLALACASNAAADSAIVRDLPPGLHVPDAAKPVPGFDVESATQAWLDLLSPQQRALSDAYFEGGYWLRLWKLLYGIGALALLLLAGWSVGMRNMAERMSRSRCGRGACAMRCTHLPGRTRFLPSMLRGSTPPSRASGSVPMSRACLARRA